MRGEEISEPLTGDTEIAFTCRKNAMAVAPCPLTSHASPLTAMLSILLRFNMFAGSNADLRLR